MTPSPLVSGSILGFEPYITIISHRARAPLVGLLNFSVAPRGWGRKEGKERGPRRASESADFAFRQPLARDLHRAVTHRTHLFVLFSLPHSCSLSQCERERERRVLRRSPKGVHPRCFDRLHSPWLRDWLILHSARIPPCHVFVPSYRLV